MAVRTGKTAALSFLLCLSAPLAALAAPASPAAPRTLAPPVETLAPAVCTDAWRKTHPCDTSARPLKDRAHPAAVTSRWWSGLWSAAGGLAANPYLPFAGKRTACNGARDEAGLLKLDFMDFQLDMDIDLDTEQDRFDTVRFAYRSCWH